MQYCSTVTLTSVSGPSNVTYSAPWGDLVADSSSNVSLTFQDTTGGNQYINMSVLASSPVGSLESDDRLPIVNFYQFGVSPAGYQDLRDFYDPGSFSNTGFIYPSMVAHNYSFGFVHNLPSVRQLSQDMLLRGLLIPGAR